MLKDNNNNLRGDVDNTSVKKLGPGPGAIERTAVNSGHRESRLREEIDRLKSELQQKQLQLANVREETVSRLETFRKEVELGKQRQNKLMFFLFVLKEERGCPVSEIFEQYIKPIKTTRFKSDFAEDYGKVLKKIKKQVHFERIYNKAIRKLKIRNCRLDYLSDSCVPIGQEPQRSNKTKESRHYIRGQLASLQVKPYIRVRTRTGYVQIPTLDIAGMQIGNIIQMRHYRREQQEGRGSEDATLSAMCSLPDGLLAASREHTGSRPHPVDAVVANLNLSEGTISEHTQAKQKLRDIVFEPVRRKRLLDSLNIVSSRAKHKIIDGAASSSRVYSEPTV